jgi:ATP-dependent helicase YprA (DUF1998 family)
MNIDNMISDFDFDQFKSDCFIHASLESYMEKKSKLSSCDENEADMLRTQFKNYSDMLAQCLKKALCFPKGCKDCVGMQKCANCIQQDDLGEAFIELQKHL